MRKDMIWPAAALLVLFAVAGCGGRDGEGGKKNEAGNDVKKEVTEAMEATREYLSGEADRIREKIGEQMSDMEKAIGKLKEKSAAAGEKGRAYRDRTLDALEEKNIAVRERMEEFVRSSGELRREAGEKLEEAMRELEEAYERAEESFSRDDP